MLSLSSTGVRREHSTTWLYTSQSLAILCSGILGELHASKLHASNKVYTATSEQYTLLLACEMNFIYMYIYI